MSGTNQQGACILYESHRNFFDPVRIDTCCATPHDKPGANMVRAQSHNSQGGAHLHTTNQVPTGRIQAHNSQEKGAGPHFLPTHTYGPRQQRKNSACLCGYQPWKACEMCHSMLVTTVVSQSDQSQWMSDRRLTR